MNFSNLDWSTDMAKVRQTFRFQNYEVILSNSKETHEYTPEDFHRDIKVQTQ